MMLQLTALKSLAKDFLFDFDNASVEIMKHLGRVDLARKLELKRELETNEIAQVEPGNEPNGTYNIFFETYTPDTAKLYVYA